jgi:hypothetical protein
MVVGGWRKTQTTRGWTGREGAADTELAPTTSWDETKKLTVFWDNVSWRFCWFQKRFFGRRSFFFHQDEESIDIMTPRQRTNWLNATHSIIHILTLKTLHTHRKMECQMDVLADHAAVFTCIKRLGGLSTREKGEWLEFILKGKYTKVGLLLPACNCGWSEPEMGKGWRLKFWIWIQTKPQSIDRTKLLGPSVIHLPL